MNTATLHPMIVHFPVALLLVGVLVATVAIFCSKCCCKKSATDCSAPSTNPTCTQQMAFWLLLLGTLGAGASILSGFLFTTMQGPILDMHHLYAFSATGVSALATALYGLSIYRMRSSCILKWVAYLCILTSGVLIAMTGHYGGMMVY